MGRLLFSSLIVVVAALAVEARASAFCRTTTCTCPPTDKALPEKNGLPQSTCGLPTGECPKDEHGCKMTGTPVAWTGGCIGFSANLAGTTQLTADQFNAAFDTAFQTWALVDCGGGRHPSIQVFTLRPTTCAASDYNPSGPNVNSIYFTDNGWSQARSATELDAILAKTKVHFGSAGDLVDADIAINSARHDFSVSDDPAPGNFDLVSVLTHEAGHFLGLDHSDDPNAVMYWQYAGGLNRSLHEDDIAAICAAYPPDRKTTCEPTPKGGLEDSCGPAPKVTAGCAVAPNEPNSIFPIALTILGVTALRLKIKRGRER